MLQPGKIERTGCESEIDKGQGCGVQGSEWSWFKAYRVRFEQAGLRCGAAGVRKVQGMIVALSRGCGDQDKTSSRSSGIALRG